MVLPVIGFVIIRRKWQLAVARNEEIKRLLVLAAEETARAEREASYVYGASVSATHNNQCALCYIPATARCAQCKSVRYWCVLKNNSTFFSLPFGTWIHFYYLFVGNINFDVVIWSAPLMIPKPQYVRFVCTYYKPQR